MQFLKKSETSKYLSRVKKMFIFAHDYILIILIKKAPTRVVQLASCKLLARQLEIVSILRIKRCKGARRVYSAEKKPSLRIDGITFIHGAISLVAITIRACISATLTQIFTENTGKSMHYPSCSDADRTAPLPGQ